MWSRWNGGAFGFRDDAGQPEGLCAIVFVRVQPSNLFGVEELVEGNGDDYGVAAHGECSCEDYFSLFLIIFLSSAAMVCSCLRFVR